ncbi:MAG: DUF2079 domain-containing protein [Bacteroidota bacterium]
MKKHWPALLFIFLFQILFTYLPYVLHLDLKTSLFDFGLEQQVVWNTANGHFFQCSVETSNYLGDHFSLITLPIALIYKVFPFAFTLFFLQTLAISFFLFGIYFIALKELKNKWFAWLILIVAAFYKGLGGLLLFNYHPIAFALPFLIWGIYFWLYEKKLRTAWILFALALICKEDVGFFIFMFGIYLFFFRRKDSPRISSSILGLTGIAVSIIAITLIIPYFRGEEADSIMRYSRFGNNPIQVVGNLIIHPADALDFLFEKQKTYYIERMSKPLAFLSVLSPAVLLTLPSLALNLLSSDWALYSGQYHYDGIFAVGIFFSGIMGISNLLIFIRRKWQKGYIPFQIIIAGAIIIINFPLIQKHRAWSALNSEKPFLTKNVSSRIDEWKAKIPENKIIAADNKMGGQFGEWTNLQLYYPKWCKYTTQPDYIIVQNNTDSLLNKCISADTARGYRFIEKNDDFIIIFKETPKNQ